MTELIPNSPIAVQKSVRSAKGRVLTSGDAGKILPLKYEWLHREDGVRSGKIRANIEMMETSEMLMNGVGVTLYAHFVPMLAYDRFNGSMDELNRSYKKENGAAGSVVPYFEYNKVYSSYGSGSVNAISPTHPTHSPQNVDTASWGEGVDTFLQTMGIHTQSANYNTTIVEAYNAIINHRRKARSKSLPLRNAFDHTLADAFWINNGMQNIVPDYDQNLIDGQVTLAGLTFQAPIKAPRATNYNLSRIADGDSGHALTGNAWSPAMTGTEIIDEGDMFLFDEIFAELTTGGNATMSLADIEQARKTAAFAKLRAKYDGIDDEHVIDLLMSGIRVPEEALKQPILLGRQRAMIGFNQRYATDGANLDKSATNGMATIDMSIRTPAMNTGGVIMLTAEIVPEQLWERKKDYFLYTTDPDTLPNYLRDVLDPEAVDVVQNSHLDINHSTPDGTFGYAPLNHMWNRDAVNVGGKYYRPANDAFDEDRAKIWTAEATNPTLNEDFYLCSGLHKKVFADQVSDAFEITCLTDMSIVGNTVFGAGLQETDATSDYDIITSQVDSSRIVK
jgi:predicted Rdx family selenoprotein